MRTNTFSGFTSLFPSTFNHIGNLRICILIGFGGIVSKFDSKRGPAKCVFTSQITESRLFHLVRVAIDLLEELLIEREIAAGTRVNPE